MAVTAAELKDFVIQPTPRAPSAAIVRAARGGRLYERALGGCLGWLFLAFGVMLAWIFGAYNAPVLGLMAAGWRAEAPGHAVAWARTHASEGGGERDEGIPVYRVALRFTTDDGRDVEANTFVTGVSRRLGMPDEGTVRNTTDHDPHALMEAHPVTVTYFPPWPTYARAENGRVSEFGTAGTVIVLIFPLVGAGWVMSVRILRRRLARLLRDGTLTTGTVVSVKTTWKTINNRPVQRVTVRYADAAGATREGHVDFLDNADELARFRAWCRDGKSVGVLYRPARPKHIVIPDRWLDARQGNGIDDGSCIESSG